MADAVEWVQQVFQNMCVKYDTIGFIGLKADGWHWHQPIFPNALSNTSEAAFS